MKKAPSIPGQEAAESRREDQRAVCLRMLEFWVPLAVAEGAAVKVGRKGGVMPGEGFEEGLKASALVLKLLERLARLDGLDSAEKREGAPPRLADPAELARRVRIASPILMGRMDAARKSEGTTGDPG